MARKKSIVAYGWDDGDWAGPTMKKLCCILDKYDPDSDGAEFFKHRILMQAMAKYLFDEFGHISGHDLEDKIIAELNQHLRYYIENLGEEIQEAEEFATKRKKAIARERAKVKYLEEDIMQRDEYKCVQCGSSRRIEVDHRWPIAHGGESTMENMRVLCQDCNRKKSVNAI